MNNIERGRRGEYAALEYLLKKGYVYRDRNFRAEKCEIDIIVMDGDTLVFVEVKARRGSGYGTGREAVTGTKQRNIIKAAQVYAVNTGMTESFIRFDVVEVDLDTMDVVHIIDAFRLN